MSDIDVQTSRRTVLHDWHAGHGARLVDFAGWDMPVQYKTGIIREHLAAKGLGLHNDLQTEHSIVGNNVGLLLMIG